MNTFWKYASSLYGLYKVSVYTDLKHCMYKD